MFPREDILTRCHQEMNLSKPVCIIYVSDKELLAVNLQALNHDYYTDVITFDYSDDDDFSHSEIYISIERVRENARVLEQPFHIEILRVCIHGMLHLGGYNDKTEAQKEKIRRVEERFLDLSRST
jgi:rRNA maturation RNase YbeY